MLGATREETALVRAPIPGPAPCQVDLEESMGSDLTIVNAARVSFAKRSLAMGPNESGLLKYLMREHHGTPFEMVVFRFRVRCPIGVSREWMRHRIGSFNEQSTRYVEMEPDFYLPEGDAVRTQVGKAGRYTFEPLQNVEQVQQAMLAAYDDAYDAYQALLRMGVAKELARNVLPLGLLTEFVWTVNLRSLLNFLALRTAPAALREIRDLATEVEQLARTVVPVAMGAWDEFGRVAP